MLAKYFRFRVYNYTKTPLVYDNGARVEVTYIPWKIAVLSVLEYGTEVKQNTAFLNTGETIAAFGQVEGSVVDNSSDLYIGLKGTLRVIMDGATQIGSIQLYVETSSDNTVWPSDMVGFKITDLDKLAELHIDTTTVEDTNYAMNFEI